MANEINLKTQWIATMKDEDKIIIFRYSDTVFKGAYVPLLKRTHDLQNFPTFSQEILKQMICDVKALI